MKRILSIDGGGIRGIIPAGVLSELERRTGRPTAECFDLIVGTSTGGILALGLTRPNASGKPFYTARKLMELYEKHGEEIFSRSFWKGMSSVGGAVDERYDHKPFERVLDRYFQEEILGNALKPVLLSSYDIENRSPFFFKSWKEEMRSVSMKAAARATSAAPTFFEPAPVAIGRKKVYLIDGGVFVNNPAVSAYAEARRLFPDETDLLVVSLGTGELIRPIPYREARSWGLVQWAIPMLNVVFDGVSDAVDYQLKHLLGERFFRFQVSLERASDDMDNVHPSNIDALKQEAKTLIRKEKARLETLLTLL